LDEKICTEASCYFATVFSRHNRFSAHIERFNPPKILEKKKKNKKNKYFLFKSKFEYNYDFNLTLKTNKKLLSSVCQVSSLAATAHDYSITVAVALYWILNLSTAERSFYF
jgi:hypothetical protein